MIRVNLDSSLEGICPVDSTPCLWTAGTPAESSLLAGKVW